MRRHLVLVVQLVWFALLLTSIVVVGGQRHTPPAPRPTVPACEEDQVIQGSGSFAGTEAGWTVYTCVNLKGSEGR